MSSVKVSGTVAPGFEPVREQGEAEFKATRCQTENENHAKLYRLYFCRTPEEFIHVEFDHPKFEAHFTAGKERNAQCCVYVGKDKGMNDEFVVAFG